MTSIPKLSPNTSLGPGAAHRTGSRKKHIWCLVVFQLVGLILVTALLESIDADRRVAACFYRPGQGWYLAKAFPWSWLYSYGTIPGLLAALAALVVFLAGFWVQRLSPWRRPCLLLVLTTVIAAGLLVNAVLKQYWGRPRPDQTIAFGGNWAYRPFYSPGTPGKGASFPCGHCTMGFVLISMAGFHRRSKALALGGVGAGVILGGLLSAARMVQGAHFLNDTIWAFGIVAMTATLLAAYLGLFSAENCENVRNPYSRRRKVLVTVAVCTAVAAMAVGFMTRRPFYSTMNYPLAMTTSLDAVHIRLNADPERVSVKYSDEQASRLQVDAHGFGWLKFDYHVDYDSRISGRTLLVFLNIRARSYFAELDHSLTLILPEDEEHKITVSVNDHMVDGSRP